MVVPGKFCLTIFLDLFAFAFVLLRADCVTFGPRPLVDVRHETKFLDVVRSLILPFLIAEMSYLTSALWPLPEIEYVSHLFRENYLGRSWD